LTTIIPAEAMKNHRQKLGEESEAVAARYLKKKGYRILEKNYRTGVGEVDLIAMDKKVVVFVEVKARRSFRFGDPKNAVTPAKQRKIAMTALSYLKKTGQMRSPARFDVVTVAWERDEDLPVIELVKNAFELTYG